MKNYRRVAESQSRAELGTNGEMECRSFGYCGRRLRGSGTHGVTRPAIAKVKRHNNATMNDIGLLDRVGRNAHFCCGFIDVYLDTETFYERFAQLV